MNLQLVILPLRHDKTNRLCTAAASGASAAMRISYSSMHLQIGLVGKAVHLAAGKREAVQQLLSEGQDPNSAGETGETPLQIAACRHRVAIADALIKARADPDIRSHFGGGDETPLFAAAALGDCRMVRYLLDVRASVDLPNSDGKSPLLVATVHGHLNVVECLVDASANLNLPDAGRAACMNPLLNAAESNHSRIVSVLLRARADADWCTVEGKSALWCAVANGSLQSARCLVRAGACVNQADQRGDAPLWVAAACNQPKAVDCLIAARANINQVAGNGQSPLCIAALRCNLPILRHLLDAGADHRRWQGQSPADLTLSAEALSQL